MRRSRVQSFAGAAIVCGLVLLCLAPASSAERATAVACKTPGLALRINGHDADAGHIFYTLTFVNRAGHACTLTGYPGVSAVDSRGHQLGIAASRTRSVVHRVTLRSGAAAFAVLRVAVAGNYPRATCRPAPAAGVRVYPPNETAAKVVHVRFTSCSRALPVYLSVKPVAATQ
jgi:Domain of unknown function (DUF4232)